MIRSGRLEEEIFKVGLVFLIYRDSKIQRSMSLLAWVRMEKLLRLLLYPDLEEGLWITEGLGWLIGREVQKEIPQCLENLILSCSQVWPTYLLLQVKHENLYTRWDFKAIDSFSFE